MKVVCLRHPHYDGTASPILSCKACCGIFITSLKERSGEATQNVDPKQWLETKQRQARDAAKPKADAKFGVNPLV